MANQEYDIDLEHLPMDRHHGVPRASFSAPSTSSKIDLVHVEPESQLRKPADPTPRKIKGPLWAVLVSSLVCANLLLSIDNTIVADVQGAIIQDLGEVNKYPFITSSFSLGSACSAPLWAQLFRLFDKKYVFLAAIVIFEVGSVVCGTAKTMNAIIIGRILNGIGGGIIQGVMNIISELTAPSERALYVSFPGTAWAIGAVIGPVIGGAISDSSGGWPWCFYLNLVIAGFWFPIYVFILPSIPALGHSPLAERIRRIDWVGFILWSGAYACGIMVICFGGNIYSWQSGQIIALFVVSGILWIVFGIQQSLGLFCDKNLRLFPVELVRSGEMWILFASMTCATSIFLLSLYFIPVYLEFIRGESSLTAGVDLLPMICPTILFLILNGAIMGKTGFYMPWYLVGSGVALLGAGLMFTIDLDSPTSRIYGFSILLGAGSGCFIQASFSVSQAKVKPEQIADVVGFISIGQISGVVISLSTAYSVFINTATSQIAGILPNISIGDIQDAIIGTGFKIFASLSPTQEKQVLQAILNSLRNGWAQLVAGAGLAFVLALLMKRERLQLKK